MGGASFYRGDIASDILFYKPNIGVFYKKQLNDYVGLRLNYEYISIGANDLQSNNFYDFKRGLNFTRVSHDVSLMGEFYFLKYINGNKQYRFTPYVGFGVGAWKSISGSTNIDTPKTQRTILFPVNLGFKYNISGSWNIFTEVTYRFTNSDKIDYFSDVNYHIPAGSSTNKQGYFLTFTLWKNWIWSDCLNTLQSLWMAMVDGQRNKGRIDYLVIITV